MSIQEADTQLRTIFLECLKRILEYLEIEQLRAINTENSQLNCPQTRERLPVFVICDTKMLKPDDYSLLTALCQKPGVAITSFNSLTNQATRDKYLTEFSKAKKLLRAIAAKLESQNQLKQEDTTKIQQNLDIHPDKILTSENTKSIFPSIPRLNSVFDFIEAHYHQPIGLNEVAQSVGYTPAYLTDLVRRQTGQSVHRWITKRRMVAACSLLLETNQSIDCIAEAVGYRNTWCFFRLFRKSFGMTPKDWRKVYRKLN